MRRADGAFNPRYTFATFVVGPSNQEAVEACRAVAEHPGSLNPLFIHGRPGLGRTHLLHAIGSHVLQHNSGVVVRYVSSQRFINGLVDACRYDRIIEFRQHYCAVDVLLLDDLDSLADREATRAELFATLEAVVAAQKQVVISSKHPPAEFANMPQRFPGTVVRIAAADLETRAAIAKGKAEADGALLPDDVAAWLAHNAGEDVRPLHGAVVRILAYAALTKRAISIDLAKEMLE